MQVNSDDLAGRVHEIRVATFGEDGIATLAQSLDIPARTWEHFENGVMIPACIILDFIEITGVEPHWLMTGNGERFRVRTAKSPARAARSS